MEMFMSHDQPQRRTLADIVMDKIRQKEAGSLPLANTSGKI